MLRLLYPRLQIVGLKEHEMIVSTSPWARLVMTPFLLFFALLCLLFLFFPVTVRMFFSISMPAVSSRDFLTWVALWPTGVFLAAVFAIPTWITWLCVIPHWLRLDLTEQKYALYEGFRVRRRCFTGPFDDLSFLIVKRSRNFYPFGDFYRTELVWKMKGRRMVLQCSYEDWPRVKAFAEAMSTKLGVPFIGVSDDIL